jgi:phage terminase Nu1 subunit (DNA packaging protein)
MGALDENAVISTESALALLFLESAAELDALVLAEKIKPAGRGKWRAIELVQARIKQLKTSTTKELPRFVSMGMLATVIDLTARRVAQLTNEGVLSKADDGKYELVPCSAQYIRHLRGRAFKNTDSELMANSKARQAHARASLMEMEQAEKAGDLIPRSQIEPGWLAGYQNIRDRMLAIPAKIAARLGMCRNAVEAQALVRREIEEALHGAAHAPIIVPSDSPKRRQSSLDRGDVEQSAAETEPAADVDDQPMG